MLWAQFKVLFPTYIGYWFFTFALAAAAWWCWTKIYRQYAFKWAAPLVLSTAAVCYMMGSTVVNFYQNSRLYAYQQKMQTSTQASNKAGGQEQPDTPIQRKAKFLKLVESLVSNPDQITPDNKKKLFDSYGSLFAKPTDKQDYEKAIASVYGCQRIFWEDAMASFKSKRVIKSDERKNCEKMPGEFFNREKLIPAETAKSNDQTIASLAAHKRVPASDGKMVEINEEMLRNIIDAQARAGDAVKKLFE